MTVYPLKFEPVFLEKIWGGTHLSRLFPGKYIPSEKNTGEIWELSARDDHPSVVLNGPFEGKTFGDLISEYGEAVAGKRALEAGRGNFPLLYKFLDAAGLLSVQVHPEDSYAQEYANDLGKMEAWYILDAEEDARIVKGLKPGYGKDDFKKLLEEERLDECLNTFSVSPGDVVFIPPKTLHTLGSGVLLFEIQQSSDVTYRAYDWGRTGSDGKSRELHVDHVFRVADFNPPANTVEPIERPDQEEYITALINCPRFVLEEVKAVSDVRICVPGDRFIAVTALRGNGTLLSSSDTQYAVGDTILLPPGLECVLSPRSETLLLLSYVPPAVCWNT